jgi:hypothetical protein
VTLREPSGSAAPAVGAQVEITADPEHIHLFDAATGERLP